MEIGGQSKYYKIVLVPLQILQNIFDAKQKLQSKHDGHIKYFKNVNKIAIRNCWTHQIFQKSCKNMST